MVQAEAEAVRRRVVVVAEREREGKGEGKRRAQSQSWENNSLAGGGVGGVFALYDWPARPAIYNYLGRAGQERSAACRRRRAGAYEGRRASGGHGMGGQRAHWGMGGKKLRARRWWAGEMTLSAGGRRRSERSQGPRKTTPACLSLTGGTYLILLGAYSPSYLYLFIHHPSPASP